MTYDKDQIEALPLLLKYAAMQPHSQEELLLAAKAEIERLRDRLERSKHDSEGMVFEVKDDRIVVDGIEFIVPKEQRKDPLVGIVLMRLARMYNITRMWEGA